MGGLAVYPYRNSVAKIAASAALSGPVFIGGRLTSVAVASDWTAAVITFQGSQDGVTWYNIYDSAGNEVSVTIAAGDLASVDNFDGAVYMKVRSGTSGSPVNQTNAESVVLLIERRPIPR